MTSACWFRCDLRTLDNPALEAARFDQGTIALFVISPQQWALHGDAPAKQWLWREAVRDLSQQLAKQGIALKLLTVQAWLDLPEQLRIFCQSHQITTLHCNREQGINERWRDRDCFTALQRHGITLAGHDGQTLLPPGSLKTGNGDFYRVFTPFARAALTQLAQAPSLSPHGLQAHTNFSSTSQTPHSQCERNVTPNAPDDIDQCWPALELTTAQIKSLAKLWPTTQTEALLRLEQFTEHAIEHYDSMRDIPGAPGTSRLSPYLAAGLLSPKQCLHAALTANGGELLSGKAGVKSWVNELLWREFYRHLLFGFGRLSMHKPLREQTEQIQWRSAPTDFAAWCNAQTGFPIVDAAMRQLLATGWMHNRLRMIVAMFLSKNLLIDWRRGEAFFMNHLIDGDLAANNGGWQWSASTGADSVPYFRVFNPLTQSQKFDPTGRFLRQWLPELSGLDDRSIHRPTSAQRLQSHYPAEIVDLKTSRLRAIATFEQLQTSEKIL